MPEYCRSLNMSAMGRGCLQASRDQAGGTQDCESMHGASSCTCAGRWGLRWRTRRMPGATPTCTGALRQQARLLSAWRPTKSSRRSGVQQTTPPVQSPAGRTPMWRMTNCTLTWQSREGLLLPQLLLEPVHATHLPPHHVCMHHESVRRVCSTPLVKHTFVARHIQSLCKHSLSCHS